MMYVTGITTHTSISVTHSHVSRESCERYSHLPSCEVITTGASVIRIIIKINIKMRSHLLAISFESDKRKIALATMYNPPETSPNVENFTFILNKFPDSIFMGDYNSKYDFFWCKKYNKEGDILFIIL